MIEQFDEPCPNWILEDVSHDVQRVFVASQDTIVRPVLPEAAAALTRALLPDFLRERVG